MSTSRVLRNYMKMFRKRSGLSQREVAFLLGCKHGSKVSRYERSERLPSPRALIGYEAIFRKMLRDLFAGVFEEIGRPIRDRARRLSRELDAKEPSSRLIKQKMNFLAEVIDALRHLR